jgi:DNA-binding NtrC family response regulator
MLPPEPHLRRRSEAPAPPPVNLEVPFKVAKDDVIGEFEKRYLKALLDWSGGNVSKAARRAKMDRMYLYRLLQRYELRGGSRIED